MIFIHPIVVALAMSLCLLIKLDYVKEGWIVLAMVVLLFDTAFTIAVMEDLRKICSNRVAARILNAAASLAVAALGGYVLWHFGISPMLVLGGDFKGIILSCFTAYFVIRALASGVKLLCRFDSPR